MHGQPGYISNCDGPIKDMFTSKEHHSGVGGKIHFSILCILRECRAVG